MLKQRGVTRVENEVVAVASIDRDLMEPNRVKHVHEYAVSKKELIMETGDGYTLV